MVVRWTDHSFARPPAHSLPIFFFHSMSVRVRNNGEPAAGTGDDRALKRRAANRKLLATARELMRAVLRKISVRYTHANMSRHVDGLLAARVPIAIYADITQLVPRAVCKPLLTRIASHGGRWPGYDDAAGWPADAATRAATRAELAMARKRRERVRPSAATQRDMLMAHECYQSYATYFPVDSVWTAAERACITRVRYAVILQHGRVHAGNWADLPDTFS